MATENLRLNITEKQERTSSKGKSYYTAKDDSGKFYSIWDDMIAAQVEIGGTPQYWSVESKEAGGKTYHNIVGRGISPEGATTAPAAAVTTPPKVTGAARVTVAVNPSMLRGLADLETKKWAMHMAVLLAQKEPTEMKHLYRLADTMLDYAMSVDLPVPTEQKSSSTSPAATGSLDNDLVPERYISQ